MKEYKDGACLKIVELAFKKCLSETRDKEEIKTRIDFVKNKEIFKLWCFVTERDPERLKNLVLIRNHKLLEKCKKKKK
jgi:hypothetical protein